MEYFATKHGTGAMTNFERRPILNLFVSFQVKALLKKLYAGSNIFPVEITPRPKKRKWLNVLLEYITGA